MTIQNILLRFNANLGNLQGNNLTVADTENCLNYSLDVLSKILFSINVPLFEEFGKITLADGQYDYNLELRNYTSFTFFSTTNTAGTVIPSTTLRALSDLGVDFDDLPATVGANFFYTTYKSKYYFIINNSFISQPGAYVKYFYNPSVPNYNQFQIKKVYDQAYNIPTGDDDITHLDLDFIFKFPVTNFIISEMLFRYRTNVKNEVETQLDLAEKQQRKAEILNNFPSTLNTIGTSTNDFYD